MAFRCARWPALCLPPALGALAAFLREFRVMLSVGALCVAAAFLAAWLRHRRRASRKLLLPLGGPKRVPLQTDALAGLRPTVEKRGTCRGNVYDDDDDDWSPMISPTDLLYQTGSRQPDFAKPLPGSALEECKMQDARGWGPRSPPWGRPRTPVQDINDDHDDDDHSPVHDIDDMIPMTVTDGPSHGCLRQEEHITRRKTCPAITEECFVDDMQRSLGDEMMMEHAASEVGLPDCHGPHISFNPVVLARLVLDLSDLPNERKGELWWQQDDFDLFLQERLTIYRGYKKVAKQLGVDLFKVSSVGSHGTDGYKTMLEAMPSLADESRRGLGLGRTKGRAKSRVAYAQAVINEQRRQWRKHLGPASCSELPDTQPDGVDSASLQEDDSLDAQLLPPAEKLRGIPLEADKISAVAGRLSKKDRDYAAYVANMYYQNDLADDVRAADLISEEKAAGLTGEDACYYFRQNSLTLSCLDLDDFDLEDAPEGDLQMLLNDIDPERTTTDKAKYATSFGNSIEKLRQWGLSATGHPLAKSPGPRHDAEDYATDDSDSEDFNFDNMMRQLSS